MYVMALLFYICITKYLFVDEIVISNPGLKNVTCPGGTDGGLSLTPGGSRSPYTFEWDAYSTTSNSLTDLAVGNYIVTINDFFNCPKTFTVPVYLARRMLLTLRLIYMAHIKIQLKSLLLLLSEDLVYLPLMHLLLQTQVEELEFTITPGMTTVIMLWDLPNLPPISLAESTELMSLIIIVGRISQ